MDRGTRRVFVGVLVVLVGVVALATVVLSAPPAPTGGPPGTSAVEGVVVGVEQGGVLDVAAFDLRTADGSVRRFGMALLENGSEFPPGHLVEHSVTAEPVRVWYRTVDGSDLAIRLEDASVEARPSAS